MTVAANLNDWANGQAPSTTGELGSWVNGNLNAQKAHYAEGEAVPFETVFNGLAANTTYSIVLTWDTTKAGKHAFDYLTSYNFDWTSNNPVGPENTQFANPLIGTSLASQYTVTQSDPFNGASVASVPTDPNLALNGFKGTPAPGQQFAMWGASITGVSADSTSGPYSGDSNTSLTITFKTPAAGTPGFNGTVVLAWADHVASDVNWGPNSGASSISGSPYHQAISPGQNLNFGSQDHQIASSVILTPGLALTKTRTSLVDTNGDGLTGDAGDVISY